MPAKGTNTMTIRCGLCRGERPSECVRCGTPALEPPQYDADALAIEIEGRTIEAIGAEKTLVVHGTDGQQYGFAVSLEDAGIMFTATYEGDDAWRALDAFLGFDARETAVDSGTGGVWPPLSGSNAVSYVVLPYDMALLVRNAIESR